MRSARRSAWIPELGVSKAIGAAISLRYDRRLPGQVTTRRANGKAPAGSPAPEPTIKTRAFRGLLPASSRFGIKILATVNVTARFGHLHGGLR